jgi:hypothetical protein
MRGVLPLSGWNFYVLLRLFLVFFDWRGVILSVNMNVLEISTTGGVN